MWFVSFVLLHNPGALTYLHKDGFILFVSQDSGQVSLNFSWVFVVFRIEWSE
jgi:hypothetical protein